MYLKSAVGKKTWPSGLGLLFRRRALEPDIVLMDTELPREDGVTTTQRLKMEMPAVTVVMLRVHDDSQTLFEAIKVGAQGYLVKNVRSRELLEQLRGLARGEIAERPVVSEHTVKNHMKSILSKLHLRNRHQAVVYGVARSRMPGPRRRG